MDSISETRSGSQGNQAYGMQERESFKTKLLEERAADIREAGEVARKRGLFCSLEEGWYLYNSFLEYCTISDTPKIEEANRI